MIIVNLNGGLGNQMFQYALGRSLAERRGEALKLDIRQYERPTADTPRTFQLEHFNIAADIAEDEEAERLKNPYGTASKVYRKLYAKLTGDYKTNYDPRVFQRQGDVYLNGVWQSELYFKDIRDILLKEFTLKESTTRTMSELIAQLEGTESVCIQVRRGDYITNPTYSRYWGTCSAGYYQNALAYIGEKTGGVPRAYVFSDDPDWVAQNLTLPASSVIVSRDYALTDYQELDVMRHGKHHIISNSTFGWWGAWLNQNPSKIVVAPTPWTDLHQDRHRDILPASWTLLPKY